MLENNWVIYNQLLENINSKEKILLSNGLGSMMHRLIIAAWRINGGKAIGFVHGNADYTANKIEYIGNDGMSLCDEMYCTSRKQKQQLNKLVEKYVSGLYEDIGLDTPKLLINE